MEGQSHIPSCNSISAVGFIKGQSLKNSSLFRRRRDLVTSSRRRVLDIVWTVSLPVISKKKDVPKVSSHWFICRIRGWIYGLVGEYIQLIFRLLTSIGITSIYLGSICTRTSFVLIVLGWIFHSQFLGVFPSGNISKFSRSLHSHVMF